MYPWRNLDGQAIGRYDGGAFQRMAAIQIRAATQQTAQTDTEQVVQT
jgi:hypothetical protein